MKLFRTIALLLLLLTPLPALADGSDAAYLKAKDNYQSLINSAKKQLYRDNWEAVIGAFMAVVDRYPDSSRAPDGLYMAARACRGLYDVSRVSSDARRATEYYDRLTQSYPRNSLADDALFESAQIYEAILESKAEAFVRYQAIVDRYPSGDMLAKAKGRAVSLVAYAPAPKALPAPEVSPPAPVAKAGEAVLTGIRLWSNPGYTRVVMDLEGAAEFSANFLPANPKEGADPRIYVDIKKTVPAAGLTEKTLVQDGLLRQVRSGRYDDSTVRVVLDLVSFNNYKVFPLQDPFRIVIDVLGEGAPALSSQVPEIRSRPPETKDGIARVLDKAPVEAPLKVNIPAVSSHPGLRRIVVDAGHGGKDPGAVGPSGLLEKDVTLAMARQLKKQLEAEIGCEVILTRDRDVYLPLEERTAIANKVGADLFISIHANAAKNREAYGVETYYLNFSKNDKAAAVAARENGTSLKQVGDLELILFDLMANSKINESSRLAAEIQKAMVDDLRRHYSDIRDLGVRQGPFYVLVGATMPSVLVEAAFISNHREESRLATSKFKEKTSAAIVKGVRNYATDLKLIANK
ncbi:N-acetylmuramoyl-L-alanine amidase [Trichloromonas sp.]|uniref:N-acetylmuramoyl-L-alanine amidase n=1 Tax=Trichloromonas sp. TaxID=3069249 RepID=UPI003D816F99